ncbi:hypothetical protein PoB_007460600 [Plakobranchus ocellatus]|uniref:Uncharacterized protein n=1 Tax=Plakobranchus ocellatus TaxID=259542 RepID=A0AAV4DW13_9GAST|nr:hypothetical protein PoB_007460600 [Plakobranchus ocellatus]
MDRWPRPWQNLHPFPPPPSLPPNPTTKLKCLARPQPHPLAKSPEAITFCETLLCREITYPRCAIHTSTAQKIRHTKEDRNDRALPILTKNTVLPSCREFFFLAIIVLEIIVQDTSPN